MEYYRRLEMARLIKLKEEEEARKREGKIEIIRAMCYINLQVLWFYNLFVSVKNHLITMRTVLQMFCVVLCYRGGKKTQTRCTTESQAG